MSATVTMARMAELSPGFKARMAGLTWLLCALTGTVALLSRGSLGLVANLVASTFLPRFVGVLMVIAGLGWLTKSLATLLSLPFGRSPYLLAPGILGEVTLALWLLAMGVDVTRWREPASAAGRRS